MSDHISLDAQLREMYGRLAYTQKTHEKMADRYVSSYRRVKIIEIVISALSSGSLLLAIFGDSRVGTVLGALLSTVLLGLLLFFKEGKLGESARRHTEAAASLWGLRERMLSLLVDAAEGLDEADVRDRRDDINTRIEKIYLGAPRTTSAAYKDAQDALKSQEELFFSDDELDRMLPRPLRVGGQR